MKKFKNLFLAAALVFGLAACNNDNDVPGNIEYNTTGAVAFRITLPASRLAGPQQAENPITVQRGTLIFTNTAGAIMHVFNIGPDPADDATMAEVTTASPHVFTGINASAVVAHFIGNTTIAPVVGANINTILEGQLLNVVTQANNVAVAEQIVNAHGTAPVVPGANPADNWTTHIQVEPTVARIELHHIVGDNTVHSFRVQGIFMDRYYSQAGVGGQVLAANRVFNSDYNVYSVAQRRANFNFPYASTFPAGTPLLGPIFDWNAAGWPSAGRNWGGTIGTLPTVELAADASIVWGYNLFAQYTNAGRTRGSTTPFIVIRLTDVYANATNWIFEFETGYGTQADYDAGLVDYVAVGYDGDPGDNSNVSGGEWVVCSTTPIVVVRHPELYHTTDNPTGLPALWLTIRGLVVDGSNIADATGTQLLPRRVYRIGADVAANGGWFGIGDIRNVPNVEPIDVEVTVELMTWIHQNGRPTF